VSVAFRRESDDEHLEPKFELPIAPGPNLVTARGFAQIEAKVEALAAEIVAEADEERRKSLGRDLRYWQTRRATAEVTTPPTDGSVGVGSRVRYRIGAQERTVSIVGGDEADPAAGLIAFSAPLARALIRAGDGEDVAFAGGTIEIVEVV
jgi:transcription elongation GreA/GreB family factor